MFVLVLRNVWDLSFLELNQLPEAFQVVIAPKLMVFNLLNVHAKVRLHLKNLAQQAPGHLVYPI